MHDFDISRFVRHDSERDFRVLALYLAISKSKALSHLPKMLDFLS